MGFSLCLLGVQQSSKAQPQNNVTVIPIEETVEKGLSQFIQRSIQQAEEAQSSHIIFNINTPGGAVDAAMEIADAMNSTEISTVAFINRRALSAGAYLALNADEIYMVPGAKMGTAAVVDLEGNAADQKANSLWLAEMKDSAERHGRDPQYALAMADPNIDLPELGAGEGSLLTLTSDQALEIGYAEGEASTLEELLSQLNLADAEINSMEVSFAEQIARFITHPVVVPILLSIGSIGLVVELYSPGFGVAGFMGAASLFLFFYGHLVAGLAGMESLILFGIGILLIIGEFFIAGGILGAFGFAAVIASLFFASGNILHMGISLLIAAAVAAAASILLVKVFGKRMKFFKRIVLRDRTDTKSGYISSKTRSELMGKSGVALTTLRPSGTALIDDERLDVVTEGGYILKGQELKIVKVEGSRIIVREIIQQT
ncbi:nodulation protein NfeD [Bacillus lacus]|uniref:Nodulation protein NfeD n=1 Tax=Metabacillus lacus TaxID=1983721 RepID=A0A7X2IWW1_9BACI|nr:nodulation protein NfeD [Metabacillus lacus]MRX71312.1 nodulation protein NfeD [Metabacillus lacus]